VSLTRATRGTFWNMRETWGADASA